MSRTAELAAEAEVIRGIGDNNPPDPFAGFEAHINDLFDEAKNFLDGEGVNTQGQADAVGQLLDQLRTAAKDADKARVEEKKPHDDAAKAVQAKWKPLLDKADLAVTTCKKALAPYLQKVEEEKRKAAEAARLEAEEKARLAQAAAGLAAKDDLAAQEEADRLIREAKKAETAANKAAGDGAKVKGGARAVSLRTSYRPELENAREALLHYVKTRPDDIKALLVQLAERDIREGKRTIPGFRVIEEQTVV